jgi:hypothetical protein
MTKSSRILLTGTVVLVAFGLMFTAACKGKSLSEKIAEKAIEKATGGKAQVDANSGSLKVKTKEGEVEFGAAAKWPADLPGDLPVFESGKFLSATKLNVENGQSWIMMIGEVDAAAVSDYVQVLKDSGWGEALTSDSETTSHFQATKDKYSAVLIYDKDGKNLAYTFNLVK